jgi:ABC-type uncharacterized transport system substrate-binding protein
LNIAGLVPFPTMFADLPRNSLSPDVIFASGNSTVAPLLQVTHTIPIVFVTVPDPVGAGFVDSLAQPGGNATGFILFEYSIGAKWLELLKQIAPGLARVAVVRDAAIAAGTGQFGAIQAAAPSLQLEVKPINLRDANEIERDITAFARSSNGGLILIASGFAVVHRDLIVKLAAHLKLPRLLVTTRKRQNTASPEITRGQRITMRLGMLTSFTPESKLKRRGRLMQRFTGNS